MHPASPPGPPAWKDSAHGYKCKEPCSHSPPFPALDPDLLTSVSFHFLPLIPFAPHRTAAANPGLRAGLQMCSMPIPDGDAPPPPCWEPDLCRQAWGCFQKNWRAEMPRRLRFVQPQLCPL